MDGYPLGGVILSMFWFMLLFAWIWLLITIFTDLFRDTSLSGWGKAGWVIGLILLPWLGVLLYLIFRGRSMNERALAAAKERDSQVREYVRSVAQPDSKADEISKLAELHSRGALSEAEFEQAKAAILQSSSTAPRQPV
jgi:Short C-terminal domain/Phospholipase_D-nuclease N-terminal